MQQDILAMVTLYARICERPRSSMKKGRSWAIVKTEIYNSNSAFPRGSGWNGKKEVRGCCSQGYTVPVHLLAALHSASSDVNILVLSSSLTEGRL